TYKGLTDEEIQEMTERLEEIEADRKGRIVSVEPRIVVEVEYSNIFAGESSSYDSGYTLRFARIKRIRENLGSEDVDTLERVSEIARKEK
ncbi:MAG: DNA ligase, partial [Candidatus Aenigmatarchaeota archaeon]